MWRFSVCFLSSVLVRSYHKRNKKIHSYQLCFSVCPPVDECASPWMLAVYFKNNTVKLYHQDTYFKLIIYPSDWETLFFHSVKEIWESFLVFYFTFISNILVPVSQKRYIPLYLARFVTCQEFFCSQQKSKFILVQATWIYLIEDILQGTTAQARTETRWQPLQNIFLVVSFECQKIAELWDKAANNKAKLIMHCPDNMYPNLQIQH